MENNNTADIVKRKEGRPTVISPETITKLESIFKIGGTVEEAVSYAEIGRSTYFDHMDRDDSFRTKIESAQHYADIVAKNVVVDSMVKNKDIQTAKWWLEKREFKQGNPQVQINLLNHFQTEAKEFE